MEACDVTKHGRHVGRRLEFCPELEIREVKQTEIFFALDM